MVNKSEQKKIDALFGGDRATNEIKVLETKPSLSCNVHSRRRSSGASNYSYDPLNNNNNNVNNNNNSKVVYRNKYKSTTDLSPRTASIISSFGFDQEPTNRRQSYSEGYYNQANGTDKSRKRNSWNSSMFRPIEHPSAFPSMLRSDTATPRKTTNGNSNGNRSSHYGSTVATNGGNNYDSLLYNAGLSALSSRRATSTSMSALNTMTNGNKTKPSALNASKRQSFGSNLYLRTDSSGQTNLVKRDSFGSRSSLATRKGSSVPREIAFGSTYGTLRGASVPREFKTTSVLTRKPTPPVLQSSPPVKPATEKASILRKPSNDFDAIDGTSDKTKLTKENLTRHVRILETDNDHHHNKSRRQSNGSSDDYLKSRRMSIDSLDTRKNSIDSTTDDLSNLSINKTTTNNAKNENGRPHFVAVTTLEDVQAVRCAEFHPSGRIYAVGSNSKTFRICEYPSLSEVREEHTTYQPTVLFKRTKHHKGSIYCMGWAPDGELVATGSNDKTIKLMRYNDVNKQLEGREVELTMHDGTVRDLCFLEDTTNKASLLISGGAGDCKIYVTDCATATPFQALSGHGGHVLSLYNWGGAMFVSGSQDKTIRFWDLRTRGCVNTVTPATNPGSRQGSPVAAVCVDPSGRLLVSGHEDSSCVLYDIRGNRPIQCFKPHSADIRSIRFSPSAYYLLTSGYDNKLVLTDLQGDLTLPLPSVVVAHHADKVISGRWHPSDFSFLSTSADKTATLWALPPL